MKWSKGNWRNTAVFSVCCSGSLWRDVRARRLSPLATRARPRISTCLLRPHPTRPEISPPVLWPPRPSRPELLSPSTCGCRCRAPVRGPAIPSKQCWTSPSSSGDGQWPRGELSWRERSSTPGRRTSFQEPGYLRLALTAISLNGKVLPIQTSSIFVKRGSHEKRNVTILRDGSGKKRHSHRCLRRCSRNDLRHGQQ